MTPYAIQKAFDTFFSTNWTATPIRMTSAPAPGTLPYIEYTSKEGDIIPIEVQGAGLRIGVLFIDIYTRTDKGDLEGKAYGGALEKLFWNKNIGAIYFDKSGTNKLGLDENRQAFHFQTKVKFEIITEY